MNPIANPYVRFRVCPIARVRPLQRDKALSHIPGWVATETSGIDNLLCGASIRLYAGGHNG